MNNSKAKSKKSPKVLTENDIVARRNEESRMLPVQSKIRAGIQIHGSDFNGGKKKPPPTDVG